MLIMPLMGRFVLMYFRYCGQEMHAKCVNQSHDGERGCVHNDMYADNPRLTSGVQGTLTHETSSTNLMEETKLLSNCIRQW